jgi:uncharacterized protein
MSLHFLDTSALAKRYVPEPGSGWVARLVSSEAVAVSELAFVELASVLSRRVRDGVTDIRSAENTFELFTVDIRAYTVIDLSRRLVLDAAGLLQEANVFPRLRSLDALQLASARIAFQRAAESAAKVGSFVSSDRALLEAARRAGLPTANPEDYG